MAVTVDTEVHLFRKDMAQTVGATQPVVSEDMELLIKNTNTMYAELAPQILVAKSYGAGKTIGTTWTDLAEKSIQFDERRELADIRLEFTGTTVRLRCTIYNAAKTVALVGPTTFTSAGDLSAAGSGNDDVVLLVEVDDTGGAGGTLNNYILYTKGLTASDLPP